MFTERREAIKSSFRSVGTRTCYKCPVSTLVHQGKLCKPVLSSRLTGSPFLVSYQAPCLQLQTISLELLLTVIFHSALHTQKFHLSCSSAYSSVSNFILHFHVFMQQQNFPSLFQGKYKQNFHVTSLNFSSVIHKMGIILSTCRIVVKNQRCYV